MANASDPGAAWERFHGRVIDEPDLGLRLDVSRMLIEDADLARMTGPMQAALEQMRRLEAGAIANPDENRTVGHYWLRAPDLAPEPALAATIRATHERVRAFAAGASGWRNLLWIGIGGSALGPQLLAGALAPQPSALRPLFLDNTDPDGFRRTLQEIGTGLDETLIAVVSKSGRTPETRNGMLEIEAALARRGLTLGPRAVAVTGAGSDLAAYARARGFLDVFPMWDWVGGRTSITSAVGLLPAALLGLDTAAFLSGAARMDEATRRAEIPRNPAAMLALAWHLAGGGHGARNMVVLPYRDRLSLLTRYLQQLVMESLGKERDLRGERVAQGLTVYGNKGSTDQHAFVQQLREGPDDFFLTFVQVLDDGAGDDTLEVAPGVRSGDYLLGFLLGTRAALSETGRRSLTITLRRLSESSLGALIALYERAVGLYAGLIGINAYHQPGVEAGKRAAERVLELQRRVLPALAQIGATGSTAAELAARIGAPEEAETIFQILEHLEANGRARADRSAAWWNARYRPIDGGR
jgi:glucose-6-phosphate isomerase